MYIRNDVTERVISSVDRAFEYLFADIGAIRIQFVSYKFAALSVRIAVWHARAQIHLSLEEIERPCAREAERKDLQRIILGCDLIVIALCA
jgi:hypothetical protein